MLEADGGFCLLIEIMRSGGCNVAMAQHSGTGVDPVPVTDTAAEFFTELMQRFFAANPMLTQPARNPFEDGLTSITGVGRIGRLRPEL